jgi:hypothetical protein
MSPSQWKAAHAANLAAALTDLNAVPDVEQAFTTAARDNAMAATINEFRSRGQQFVSLLGKVAG